MFEKVDLEGETKPDGTHPHLLRGEHVASKPIEMDADMTDKEKLEYCSVRGCCRRLGTVNPRQDEKKNEGGIIVEIKLKWSLVPGPGGPPTLPSNNTKFVNGAVVGERNVFQVDQRLGIGSKFPFFNRRHQLTLTRFIQLQQVEEGAGKPPPPVLVLHGHYGGCVGDLPSYEAFCSWRSILCPWLQHGGARCGQKHPREHACVYAFAEHWNDLGSSKDVKGNPTAVYRRMGQGSSYGVGVKLGLVRAEYALDHNNGTGALIFIILLTPLFKVLRMSKHEKEKMRSQKSGVLDIAYDVEDVLDTYFLKFKERSQRKGLMRLANKIGEKKDIRDDIRSLKRRLVDITRKRQTYGVGRFKEVTSSRRRFEYRAWTYVSQDYNTRDMLLRIIRSLGVASGEELERIKMFTEEEELEAYLHDLLDGRRYLVVVDDVWKQDAWESLKRALPCNHGGNRVIITTRIKAVAEGVDGRVYVHKLRFLTFEESWKLFDQKAFMNFQWVQKCDGLPLAIVVLAGLLSKKRPNEWHEVCASVWRFLKDNSIHISTVFDLSFNELHYELKLCFLYLSVFPEDYEIDVEKLIHSLVAEGFIQEDGEMTMEDVARHYIEELIDISLVEAVRRERGKVVFCRIHDLLRDVAIKKAKEINFVSLVYNEHHSSTTCRREVVHHLMDNNYLCDRRVNKRMRSFLFFGEQKGMLGRYIPFMSLPDVICELIHLRYLGVADTGLRHLPSPISNLQFLQTLDASGNRFEGMTDLRKLTSLRHLMGRFIGELLIGDAVNLQTLRSISSYSWSKIQCKSLKNLRDLEIYDSGYVELTRVRLNLSSFSNLTNLRALTLRVPTFRISSEAVVFHMDVFFPSLESLTFSGTNLEEDPMPALQKLPRLEDLVLEDCDCSEVKMSSEEACIVQGKIRFIVDRRRSHA
ncbi:unnamed protein product [Brassica oleracea]